MANFQRVDFFDAMAANNLNSLLLMAAIGAFFMLIAAFFSYMLELGYFGLIIGFFAIAGYAFLVFFAGDRMVLAATGARKLEPLEHPFIHNVVEGLAAASQISVPQVYVIEDPSPNAFATGRDPQHASVAVTTGLLQMLDRQELEGVLAHEVSHIANYDIRFMMLAIVFAGAIGFLSSFALQFFRFSGSDRRRGGRAGGLLMLLGLLLMLIAPMVALLVRLAISRQREYFADANAARLTRNPSGLASALEKITGSRLPMQNASEMTAPLFITNPFHQAEFLFSTHPDPADRVRRLRAMY